ncbi:hypothetical protein V6N11_012390 [Hibiscus sabdariffa]|uniref:Uncharacterized protein n=1 Tax=Hibiscus sabdariffa TaxID=183260 RepID=A0ABR2QB50_9ROSI
MLRLMAMKRPIPGPFFILWCQELGHTSISCFFKYKRRHASKSNPVLMKVVQEMTKTQDLSCYVAQTQALVLASGDQNQLLSSPRTNSTTFTIFLLSLSCEALSKEMP